MGSRSLWMSFAFWLGSWGKSSIRRVKGFVYAKDWKNAERFEAYRYNRPLDIRTISEYIANNITRLEETAIEDPQKVLCELRDLNITGLGTVYLITLLYFISRGKYPIYDRFAWMAIQAICGDKKPGEAVAVTELPWKNSMHLNGSLIPIWFRSWNNWKASLEQRVRSVVM